MFDSPVIEVVVGLTFLFLVMSFCATAAVEAVSEWRQWRARLLHGKLETILGREFVQHLYCERRVADLASGLPPPDEDDPDAKEPLAAKMARGVNDGLRRVTPDVVIGRFTRTSLDDARQLAARMNAKRLPPYIPESVFADVVLDWLQGISLPHALHPDTVTPERMTPDGAMPVLGSRDTVIPYDQAELWTRMNRRADGDQALLREEIVRWYRQTTERVGGDFRRMARHALYIVGFVMVVLLNLDAIRMTKTLYGSPALRAQYAAAGEALVESCPEQNVAACKDFERQARDTLAAAVEDSASGLIGWPNGILPVDLSAWPPQLDNEFDWHPVSWMTMVLGWLLTILAIGMGADFWFGLLKKIVSIRSSERLAATDEPVAGVSSAQPDTPAPRTAQPRDPLNISSPDLAPLKGFQPLRFAESNVHAFWLGHYAHLAYGSAEEYNTSALVDLHGLVAKGYDEGGTQATLFTGPALSILAFRGTEQVPEDWITDARIKQKENPWGVGDDTIKVHQGFHDALDHIWDGLVADIAQTKVPLWITGHSLGGALAVLAAYRLASLKKKGMPTIGGVYTFGQPRAGNAEFAMKCPSELTQRIFRYVNASDIVPLVPPSHLEGYSHVGHFRYFDSAGRLHHERTLWERIAERLAPAIAIVGRKDADWRKAALDHAKARIADHSMSRYIECLERIDAVRGLQAK